MYAASAVALAWLISLDDRANGLINVGDLCDSNLLSAQGLPDGV